MTKALVVLALFTALLFTPHRALAALDDVLKTSEGQQVTVGAQPLKVRVTGELKEFAANSGKVFAAAWTGRTDLHALLGTHYAAYLAAVRSGPRGQHGFLSINTPELSMRVAVHGAHMVGRVCLTQSLPKGVSFDTLH